jgi:MarR family transcriptional regulator, organic hydroperoxide resistance regulator
VVRASGRRLDRLNAAAAPVPDDPSHDPLPAEQEVRERLGHLPLDFAAMAVISNLFRASTAVRRHLENRVLAPHRLSWTSFVVLWVLWVWGEMESRDVATAVGVTRPTCTGVVSTLERRKLVRRTRGTADARMVRVSLTTAGTRLIEQLFPEFNREEAALTAHLSAAQREDLAGALRSLLRAVEQDERPAQAPDSK